MQDIHHRLTETLQKRKDQNRFRSLATNSQLIDFSSNDYLGLARSEKLKRKIEEEIEKFSRKDAKAQSGDINGVFAPLRESDFYKNGSTGSRLLTGNSKYAEDLEQWIADFHFAEAGLIFNSGYD